MIRTLLIATVVVLGTTSSVIGSIIAPQVELVSLTQMAAPADAEANPALVLYERESSDSLASALRSEVSAGGTTALGLCCPPCAIDSPRPTGIIVGGGMAHVPTPPISDLLRPPRSARMS